MNLGAAAISRTSMRCMLPRLGAGWTVAARANASCHDAFSPPPTRACWIFLLLVDGVSMLPCIMGNLESFGLSNDQITSTVRRCMLA